MDVLLWVLVGVMVVGLILILTRRGRGAVAQGIDHSATPEFAAEASAKLDDTAHREIYAAIAQGRQRDAVTAYQDAVGSSMFEAAVAVAALAKHPQPYRGRETPSAGDTGAAGAGGQHTGGQHTGVQHTGSQHAGPSSDLPPLSDPFTDGRLDGLGRDIDNRDVDGRQ